MGSALRKEIASGKSLLAKELAKTLGTSILCEGIWPGDIKTVADLVNRAF